MTQTNLFFRDQTGILAIVARFVFAFFCVLISLPGLQAESVQITRETGRWKPDDKMQAFLFDAGEYRLQVIDEGSVATPKYGSLEKALLALHCEAGVNGGYFGADPAASPLGLLIEDGRTLSPFAGRSFTVAGVVYDTGSTIHLVRSAVYARRKPSPRQALQGGPFLVENGRVVPGLHRDKVAFRTFIATDGKGRWCIGTTSPMSLADLAAWLASPEALPGFKVHDALNLDGGSSSAYWVKSPHRYYPSIKRVRSYLGVAKRSLKQ